MASTVYSGNVTNGNITHTNSSGKNERVLIYYLFTESSAGNNITMEVGPSLSWNLNSASNTSQQVWGINLGINVYAGNASSMTNHMSVKSSNGSATGIHIPLEFYLANGHVFKLTSTAGSAPIDYNFIVITED